MLVRVLIFTPEGNLAAYLSMEEVLYLFPQLAAVLFMDLFLLDLPTLSDYDGPLEECDGERVNLGDFEPGWERGDLYTRDLGDFDDGYVSAYQIPSDWTLTQDGPIPLSVYVTVQTHHARQAEGIRRFGSVVDAEAVAM